MMGLRVSSIIPPYAGRRPRTANMSFCSLGMLPVYGNCCNVLTCSPYIFGGVLTIYNLACTAQLFQKCYCFNLARQFLIHHDLLEFTCTAIGDQGYEKIIHDINGAVVEFTHPTRLSYGMCLP